MNRVGSLSWSSALSTMVLKMSTISSLVGSLLCLSWQVSWASSQMSSHNSVLTAAGFGMSLKSGRILVHSVMLAHGFIYFCIHGFKKKGLNFVRISRTRQHACWWLRVGFWQYRVIMTNNTFNTMKAVMELAPVMVQPYLVFVFPTVHFVVY